MINKFLFSNSPIRLLVASLICGCTSASHALPLGPQVVGGTAVFIRTGNLLTISNGNNAILNWQQFNIAASEAVRFNQPSATSSVLNRVLGADPSAIYGQLSSNGRVWLINPAGILVGPNARIETAGLVASTLNLRNEDFLAGKLSFVSNTDVGSHAGSIANHGTITTPNGGSVYLIASNVTNQGIITTPRGETILAAGQSVRLIDTAMPGVNVEVVGSEGNATNLGSIVAEAGRIGVVGVLVKNSGTLNASSVVSQGGRIFLKAGKDTHVDQDARIDSTGKTGGSIEVLGNRIAVTDQAQLDASGQNGGGSVLLGGDYQGRNPGIQNASATYFGPQASIKADAIQRGDGGKVILWSNETTRAYGRISARGGLQSGAGGFVETSGGFLEVTRAPEVGAQRGKNGTWLLDPYDIVIGASDTPGTYVGNPDFAGSGAGSTSTIGVAVIETALASGSVFVDTTSFESGTGNITVSSPINWATSSHLSLRADGMITINAPITAGTGTLGEVSLTGTDVANNSTITGPGGITVYADTLANAAGVITTGGAGPGQISLFANSMALAGGKITAGAGGVILGPPRGDRPINLGSTVAGKLNLLGSDLQTITASGGLEIYNFPGEITVSGPITAADLAGLAGGRFTLYTVNGSVAVNAALTSPVPLFLYVDGAVNVKAPLTATKDAVTINGTSVTNSSAIAGLSVFILADTMSLAGGTITAGADGAYLQPLSASRPVNLGGTAADTLSLLGADLQSITASGGLEILNYADDINVAGPITSANLAGLTGGWFMLYNYTGAIAVNAALASPVPVVLSGSRISQSGGSISAPALTTYATGGTTLNGANAVLNFEATDGGAVSLTNTAANLTLGPITAASLMVSNSGDLTTAGDVASTGNQATLTLLAGNHLVQDANITSNGGTIAAASRTEDISMAPGVTTSSNGGNIDYAARENIVLASLNAGSSGAITLAAGGNVSTVAGSSGANLIGARASVKIGGKAGFSTLARTLDVNVGGSFRINDMLTGAILMDAPPAEVQSDLEQVINTVITTTTRQETPDRAVEHAEPPLPPAITAGSTGQAALLKTSQTIGGAEGTFGGNAESKPAEKSSSEEKEEENKEMKKEEKKEETAKKQEENPAARKPAMCS